MPTRGDPVLAAQSEWHEATFQPPSAPPGAEGDDRIGGGDGGDTESDQYEPFEGCDSSRCTSPGDDCYASITEWDEPPTCADDYVPFGVGVHAYTCCPLEALARSAC